MQESEFEEGNPGLGREVERLIRLSPLAHMEGQLDAVAQILLIQDATDVALYRPQTQF